MRIRKSKLIYLLSDIFMYICFFATFVVTNIYNNDILLRIRLIATVIAGILGLLAFIRQQRKMNLPIFLFIVLMIVSWILIAIFRPEGMLELNQFIYSMCYMGIALNLLSHKQKILPAAILYYGTLLIMLYRLLIQKVAIRGFLLDGTSYNYISILAMLYLMLYCLILIQNDRNIPFIIAIPYFVVCILAYGRGGCISGILFLGAVIYINFGKIRKRGMKFIVTTSFIILLIIFFQTNIFYDFVATYFGKFQVAGYVDEARITIWSKFIENNMKGVSAFLLGSNPGLIRSDLNLHNTFLQCWAHFGFLTFLISFYSYIRGGIQGVLENKKAYVAMLLIFVIRATTDRLAFWGYSEPFFYYFIFHSMLNQNEGVAF